MIERYSRPEMRSIWTEQRKLEIWLEIETLACEGMAELGIVPKEDARTIREKGTFRIEEVREIEKRTNHDVIAFLEEVANHVGEPARWIHRGLTSSDLLDTTLAVQMVQSADILLKDLGELRVAIAERAKEHKFTPMIGRSHGIHAEPVTFGLKLGVMYDEFTRAVDRLKQTRERVAYGMLSGAVGTNAHLDPKVEAFVCERLGLKPATISTQIIQRDRHADFMTTLALIGCSIDCWATEFRHLNFTFGPNREGEAYLTLLPVAGGGGMLENLNRWRKQMAQPPVAEADLASLPEKTIFGRKVPFLDLTGTFTGGSGPMMAASEPKPDYRMLGAIFEAPGFLFTIKMTGPTALVTKEAANFDAFCQSLGVGGTPGGGI
jgi:hypothetical protein